MRILLFLVEHYTIKTDVIRYYLLLKCLPTAWEIRVQSQIESYQSLKKWYLMPLCLTLSIIRYVSRVKWSNPGKGVALSPTPQCRSYWKGNLVYCQTQQHWNSVIKNKIVQIYINCLLIFELLYIHIFS